MLKKALLGGYLSNIKGLKEKHFFISRDDWSFLKDQKGKSGLQQSRDRREYLVSPKFYWFFVYIYATVLLFLLIIWYDL